MRLGDVDPSGRCRLDATVRYLQDVARDDSADSGLVDPMSWVVRRTMLEVAQAPVFFEEITIATWCSGYGSRWAERRTEVRGDEGARLEAVTLWIYIDPSTGAPRKLNDDFYDLYGESSAGRRVSARQQLESTPAVGSEIEAWPVRVTDLDLLAHVNNAAQWATVEHVADRAGLRLQNVRAELEHGVGIGRGVAQLHSVGDAESLDLWLMTDEGVGCAARVRPR